MRHDTDRKSSVIFASGGIITRQSPGGTEVLIIHRSRYDDWCLPKGKLNDNETFEEAAVREVKEETGYDSRITGFAGCTCYEVKQKPKVVLFWKMETIGECSFKPSEEVMETMWLNVNRVGKKLDYVQEKDLVKKISINP